jgi:hypothetical protein
MVDSSFCYRQGTDTGKENAMDLWLESRDKEEKWKAKEKGRRE